VVPAAAPPKSTNPISTKCTARNPCPTAPTPPNRASPNSAAAARSSSRRIRGSRARSSDRRHGRAAARRDIGVGGRRGRCDPSELCELRTHWPAAIGMMAAAAMVDMLEPHPRTTSHLNEEHEVKGKPHRGERQHNREPIVLHALRLRGPLQK
jgi:hypothetical protein